jgi:hypothetical protein
MSAGAITLPTAPAGPRDHLTANEKAWIEFIRVISCGSDPKITPTRVCALRALLDAGSGVGEGKVSRSRKGWQLAGADSMLASGQHGPSKITENFVPESLRVSVPDIHVTS